MESEIKTGGYGVSSRCFSWVVVFAFPNELTFLNWNRRRCYYSLMCAFFFIGMETFCVRDNNSYEFSFGTRRVIISIVFNSLRADEYHAGNFC